VDGFDYLPEYEWPAGEAPYGEYPDSRTQPMGQYRGQGQSDYAYTRAYGVPEHLLTDGWQDPGRPPRGPGNGRGYPPASGPMQAFQPPDASSVAGYPPVRNMPTPPSPPYHQSIRTYKPDSGPIPAYRPDMSGPMEAYQPGISGPMWAYRPDISGPMQAYQPDMSGPMTAYQAPSRRPAGGSRPSTGLLSEFPISEPIRAYEPPTRSRPPQRSSANGREILGWLPLGNRLVLMPKDLADDDEELREHRDVSDGWLRPAVFGAMDGLVTNASLIAGVGAGAGGGAHSTIVLTGIAGLIAGAFSMATGEYVSVSSQNELTQAEVELERKQLARDPAGKLRRLAHLFVEKGVSPNLAEAVVRQISADPERAVAAHVRE
jgi:hypothetical protein